MKSFVTLLLCIAAGIAGYFLSPSLLKSIGLIMPDKPVKEEVEIVIVEEPKEEAPVMPAPKVDPTPMPQPEVKPDKPVTPAPTPKMANTGLGEVAPKVDADGFTLPQFDSVDELMKNWSAIPKNAFPREITINRDLKFEVVIGANRLASEVRAGSKAWAMDQQGQDILIAPSKESKARNKLPIEQTNLKQVLTQDYENWKVARTATLKRMWQRDKNAALAAANPNAAQSSAPVNNSKPVADRDGKYPILIASMNAGDVTEVTEANITKWEDAVQEEYEGKTYWTVVVTFVNKTMFGDFTAYGKAYIYNGKVEKWLYRDSLEVIP